MRHDTTPKEMLLGLYGMAYRYYSFSRSIGEAFASYTFDIKRVPPQAANALRIVKGLSAHNAKGCVNMMRLMERGMEKFGWETDSPVQFDLPPKIDPVTIVGLKGSGACAECVAKPPVPFQYALGSFNKLMRQTINNNWRALVAHEAYREHQMAVLRSTNYFDESPEGLEVEAAYRACGGVIQSGLECLVRPTEAFIMSRIKVEIENKDVHDQIVLNRRLRDICDVELNRDWCQNCAPNLVTFDRDLFKLLK